ncbi:carboxypeptidase D-like isoform X2 [Rhodnius prolixus]|uniref:carboxypeptidase D-like isoform X2 n=1 Tax=Rhodnius prolixus TaxID=13249 RepID=UPI003D18ED90
MKCTSYLLAFATTVLAIDDITYYLSNEELYMFLEDVNENHPNISYLYSIGSSVEGEELWVLMMTLAPLNEIGVPNVKVIGNIHGNEPVGRELIVSFIKMLVKGYLENDQAIVQLLTSTRIHLLPSANPDGFTKALEGECIVGPGRRNANNMDLNRNFILEYPLDAHRDRLREEETLAIINWMTNINFVLSVSIHSGSLVVVYPYDECFSTGFTGTCGKSPTDDDDVFRHLALTYASNTNGAIYNTCPGGQHFENGIINGAAWFESSGTMGDFNYRESGCMELTVEVSCCKYPHPSRLNDIVDNNLGALTAVIGEVHQGVKGVVTCGGEPTRASVTVVGRNMTTLTTDNGEYWRILLPGRYFLLFEASSVCTPQYVAIEIPRQKTGKNYQPLIVNVNLKVKWIDDIDEELELEERKEEEINTNSTTLESTTNRTGGINNVNVSTRTLVHLEPRMESSISSSASLFLCKSVIVIIWVIHLFLENLRSSNYLAI